MENISKFEYSPSPGTFVDLKKVEVSTDNGTTWGLLWKGSRLPDGYQEVKYIESTGTQWINTDITPDAEKIFDIDISFAMTSRLQYANIFTSQASGSNLYITRLNGDTDQFVWYSCSSMFQYILNPISYDTKYNMSIHYESGHNSLTIPNHIFQSNTNATITTTAPFIICSNRPTSSSAYPAKAKIYSCKIKIDNVGVRNFVPCYRKSDNEIGLYDLINNNFYTNSGTGEFSKGGDV